MQDIMNEYLKGCSRGIEIEEKINVKITMDI